MIILDHIFKEFKLSILQQEKLPCWKSWFGYNRSGHLRKFQQFSFFLVLLKAIRHPDISGRSLVLLKPEFIYMKSALHQLELIQMRLCLAKRDRAPVQQGWDRVADRVALCASISEIHLCLVLVAWGCSCLELMLPSAFYDFNMANQWVWIKSWIWALSNIEINHINKGPCPLCFCYLLLLVPSVPWDIENIHEIIAFCKLTEMETHCIASKYIATTGEETA